MPPVNAKVEAERLQKARVAIAKMKKMKNRRPGADKVEARGSTPNVKVPQFSGDSSSEVVHSKKVRVEKGGKSSESGASESEVKDISASIDAFHVDTRAFRKKAASSREERAAKRNIPVMNGHGKHGERTELGEIKLPFAIETKNAAPNGDTIPPVGMTMKRKKVPLAVIPQCVVETPFGQQVSLFETPPEKLQNDMLNELRKSLRFDTLKAESPFLRPSAVSKVYINKKKVASASSAGSCSELKQPDYGAGGTDVYPGERVKRVSFSLDAPEDATDVHRSRSGERVKRVSLNLDSSTGDEKQVETSSDCQPPKTMKRPKTNEINDVGESSDSSALKHQSMKGKKLLALKLKKSRIAGKKIHAPMSIKMTSGSGKGPVFIVSESESKKGDILSMKLSKIKQADTRHKSAFTVTTVPEKVLSINDETSSDSSVSEDDELSDAIEQDAEELQGSSGENEADERLDDHAETSLDAEDSLDGIESILNDGSKVQFYFIDDQLVLHLKHPTSFAFCGHVQVEVLKGAVDVLGFLVTPSSGSHSILSPLKKPLLTMQTVAVGKGSSLPLSSFSHDLAELVQSGNSDDAFILMRKEDNTMLSFLEQYMKKDFLPRPVTRVTQDPNEMADNYLRCVCMPSSRKFRAYQKGKLWDEVFTNVSKEPGCTLLSGGKGVGKSTMLRHFVNRYLSSGMESVVVIDFDPGQSELTIPGCVSLTVVKKPLLGPNFYNQQDPLKCIYVGEVNLVDCVSRYINACSAIINYWRSEEQFRKMPCLVNTMGFTQGLGVTLMVQILSILQPTSVIQIQSSSAALNYPELLSVGYVKRSFSNSPFRLQLSAQSYQSSSPSNINYDLHVINSEVAGARDQRKIIPAARSNRDAAVLSYVSKIVCPPYTSLLQVVPYCCPLDTLYLHVSHESVSTSVILSTFNASMVGLCYIEPEKEDITAAAEPGLPSIVRGQLLADCLGFGIVRGIDMESRKLYLLTPVAPNVLSSVNCLVLGAICLPSGVYMSPPKVEGFVPYVVTKKKSLTPTYFERSK